MAFKEDLGLFFDCADFGTLATVKPAVGPSFKLRVILNTPTQELQIFDASVEADSPNVLAITEEISRVTNKATLTIGSKVYRVVRVADDGTGVSTIFLA